MSSKRLSFKKLKEVWPIRRSSENRAITSGISKSDYSFSPYVGAEQPNIVGLTVDEYGRMGNNLLQTSNALLLSRSLRLPFIQLPETELIRIQEPVKVSEITFLPENYDTSSLGHFLRGTFYKGPRLERLGIRMPLRKKVLKKYLIPAASISIPHPEPAGCLTIHLRSGDAFDENPHPDFAQPPLSFYTMIIEKARQKLEVNRVQLVFENRRNPCVNALEAHLERLGLPVILQSGTLADDVNVLLSARHLVFGYGTFGVGICLLSNAVETVDVFGASGFAYSQFDHLKSTNAWGDLGGRYPKIGEWTASQEQLGLMIDFPETDIGILDEPELAQDRAPDWWIVPDGEL